MRRKKEFDFSELEVEAREFISKRVRKLGSVEAVCRAYRLDDMVSAYAIQLARFLFRKKRRTLEV